jgi:ribosomal protein S13
VGFVAELVRKPLHDGEVLPVRGQRTRTNARTRKGPRKARNAIAGK